MGNKFTKPFWEKVKVDELKDGDIIHIIYKEHASYDHYRIINGKWFNIFEDKFIDYFKPSERIPYHIYRQNYKFISKTNEWFVGGTEAYLECEPWGDENQGYSALFRGWHKNEKTGKVSEDGESCPFEEFDIQEL